MTHTMCRSIGTLRTAMTGPVIGPAEEDYDQARRVWNADIDRRPAMIARCASEDDTAFSGGRSPRFAVFIVAVCLTPDLLAADRAWARSFWEALRPHSLGSGSYVNAMTEFDDDRVRAAYGPAKYQRLAAIKKKYDPQNLFHHNANIHPA